MEKIREITEKLYSGIPSETLYHYTTFTGLLGIIDRRALWVSDIRYMNDSAELRHATDLIQAEISRRIAGGHAKSGLLNRFLEWVSHRITNGNMLFGASFRSNGNLLSQWRGFSSMGKGVSLGFTPDYILACARRQSFQVGRCIYTSAEQDKLIERVIDAVEELSEAACVDAGGPADPPSRCWHGVFEKVEHDLLRIAALLKHPSFQEEDEWRIVSPAFSDDVTAPVLFREGASMLVPYVEFDFLPEKENPIALEHIFLGPTPNIEISMNSLAMFLSKNGIRPNRGISYCQIPFRQR